MELVIIILGVLLDRFTKSWAIETLALGKNIIIIKDFFGFSYLENRGAAFGIFRDKLIFLTTITIMVILVLIVFMFKYKTNSKMLKFSLAFIISGAIGNLIDRIKFKYVVDFILIHYKDAYYFPTFNIADVLVTIGTILLAIYMIKEEKYGDGAIFN